MLVLTSADGCGRQASTTLMKKVLSINDEIERDIISMFSTMRLTEILYQCSKKMGNACGKVVSVRQNSAPLDP